MPMLFPLVLIALVLFAGAILLYASGLSSLPPVHLALASGAMPLIAGAMIHFVPVLTLTGPPGGRVKSLPWLMLLAGVLAFSSFVLPSAGPIIRIAAALLGITGAAAIAWWVLRQSRMSLGKPYPGVYWYLAAMICLLLGLLSVLLMQLWPSQYLALRRFHLHLNTLGFIGITAVGTLQVLLPTALGTPDSYAPLRLQRDLKWVLMGTLLIATGAAWAWPLIWPGLLCWLWPLVRLGIAWLSLYREASRPWNANATAIAGALPGLLVVFIFGVAHASNVLPVAHASLAYVCAFLLPLVSGAASYLIPLWLRPGLLTQWHVNTRLHLARYSPLRLALFLGAGTFTAMGHIEWGLALAAIALALFLVQLSVLARE